MQQFLSQRGRAGLVIAVFGLGWTSLALAGDPIIFSAQRVRSSLVPVRPVERELLESLDKLSAPTPYDGMTPASPGRRSAQVDPRRSRRAKLAAEERRNWLWYDSGELQEQDEEDRAFGLTSFETDEADREVGERDDRRSQMSDSGANSLTKDRDSRIPMHLLSPRQREHRQMRVAQDSHSRSQARGEEGENGERTTAERPETGQAGLHTSEELDMRSLLAPAPEMAEGAGGGKAMTLRELFGNRSGSGTRGLPELSITSQTGDKIDLSKPVLPPLITSDSLNLKPNFGEDRLGPLMSRSSESVLDTDAGTGGGGLSGIPAPTAPSRFSPQMRMAAPPVGRSAGGNGRMPYRGVAPTPSSAFDPRSMEIPRRGGTLGR